MTTHPDADGVMGGRRAPHRAVAVTPTDLTADVGQAWREPMTAAVQPEAGVSTRFGVHSEVGKLRRVMIHRPDLELTRLTPTHHDHLLLADVLRVRRARQQHDAFGDLLRDRGVEVLYLETLLAEAIARADARKWVLDRAVTSFTVGAGMFDEIRAYMNEVDPVTLADHLIGGLTVREAGELLKGKGDGRIG